MKRFLIIPIAFIIASLFGCAESEGQCCHCGQWHYQPYQQASYTPPIEQPENSYQSGNVYAGYRGRARVRQGSAVWNIGLINITQGMHKSPAGGQTASTGQRERRFKLFGRR